jgi:hypothetical protein
MDRSRPTIVAEVAFISSHAEKMNEGITTLLNSSDKAACGQGVLDIPLCSVNSEQGTLQSGQVEAREIR